jgi:hypothetical protein
LKLADAADLNLGTSYTISFWMKPDTIGGAVDPTLTAGTFSPEYWLNLTFDAKIWSHTAGAYVATTDANVYKAGEWQHVAIRVDGDTAGTDSDTVTAYLYVNGQLVSSGNIAKQIMTKKNSAIYFGVNAWDAYFKGTLDDVMIMNRTLSESEVQAIAEGVLSANDVTITAGTSTDDTVTDDTANGDVSNGGTTADDTQKSDLSIKSISAKVGAKKITGTVSTDDAVVKVKVNSKAAVKAVVSGKKFTVTLKSKLKAGDAIKVTAAKDGYNDGTKTVKLLKAGKVSAKKAAKKVTGTVSVKKAKVTVKVGKKSYKAKVSGKKFSVKVKKGLKKGTSVKITIKKSGYLTLTKTVKAK